MKLNIFLIPQEDVQSLKSKLESSGMTSIYRQSYDSWSSEFYFSNPPEPTSIPWAADLAEELAEVEPAPMNLSFFGAYLWTSSERSFAISFGKTFLYLRDFCEHSFGLDMARRIGKRSDVRQKSARRYAGKRKREIRSYQRESALDVESGESVDYIQAATVDGEAWGKTAKFGSSILLTLPISVKDISDLLDRVCAELEKPALFGLPITEPITDEDEQRRLDDFLVNSILGEGIDFEASSYQVIGVDFLFPGHDQYVLRHFNDRSDVLEDVSIDDLRAFIVRHKIPRDSVLNVKVKVRREAGRGYTVKLREALDFTVDAEKSFLQNGQWVRFNEDYLSSLNDAVDRIAVDSTLETELLNLHNSVTEPPFNRHLAERLGYRHADTDFSLLQVEGHKVEACDLIKGTTLYAVKFGQPQKLSYVCNQAAAVIELISNEPSYRSTLNVDTYCIWLGLERVGKVAKVSEINSIILKQRLDDWARKCLNLGITPILRISYKNKLGTFHIPPDANAAAVTS